MTKSPATASLWQRPMPGWEDRLAACVEKAVPGCAVWFRADDAGVPGKSFSRLLKIFAARRVPLCLAVVPAWLTGPRWEAIRREAGPGCSWHQHGFRHANHEPAGKKSEFGASRTAQAVGRDILSGRERLERIMGKDFFPAFTPPWNRCGQAALDSLAALGFAAVSRSRGCLPKPPDGLAALDVDVDLHTLREPDPQKAWDDLFESLKQGLSRPVCGIMIHHRAANSLALDFLELLLDRISRRGDLRTPDFARLIAGGHGM